MVAVPLDAIISRDRMIAASRFTRDLYREMDGAFDAKI
jgi:hypothetical protein